MSNVNSAQSAAMGQAIELLRRGDTAEAERVMVEHVRQVAQEQGSGGPRHQLALNELGLVLLNARQQGRAVEAFQAACAGPLPDDAQDLRDRLTHLMNLGQALELSGRLDEAEQALRQGLAGRARCYGTRHPGYAFGLEPLSTILLRQGKLDEACAAIDETLQVFWRSAHPRVPGALALRAEIHAASGRTGPLFEGHNELPRALFEQMVESVLQRPRRANTPLPDRVLDELFPIVAARLGPGHPLAVNTLIGRAGIERLKGPHTNHEIRIRCLRQAVAALDSANRPLDAVNAQQGLALAFAEAAQAQAAQDAYKQATDRARAIDDPGLLAGVLRNFGLFESRQQRPQEAEALLRESLAQAQRAASTDLRGRAHIALGIFLQHAGRLDEAAAQLREGIPLLDPADPDALAGRGHLSAVESGGGCGCGNSQAALVDALRAHILPHLPPGLVERLDFTLDEQQHLQPSVELTREPTESEMEQVHRVISQAIGEFRHRLGQPG